MKKYKFSDLLKYGERVKKLYSKYGLNLNPASRINQYFLYLLKLEKARKKDPVTYKKIFAENRIKFYFSQFYVMEMFNIMRALDGSKPDVKILRKKLLDLSKGTFLLSEESASNTKARDTSFELSLFAFLKKFYSKVELCDPNPDIKLITNNFTYNIECKRPSSTNSIEHQLRKAKSQLSRASGARDIPTIALSLEQIFLKKTLEDNGEKSDILLDSKNEDTAREFLNATLFDFLKENNPLLGRVFGDKPCLVLYFISSLVGFRTDIPMANATFMTGNVFNFPHELAEKIMADLRSVIPESS